MAYSSIRKTFEIEHVLCDTDYDYYFLRSAEGTILEVSSDFADLFETLSSAVNL